MMKIIVINGPNLNLLGTRKTNIYGTKTLEEINNDILSHANKKGIEVDFYQSNFEGEIIEKLHISRSTYDGVIINPGAFTHYSYAIADAVEAIDIPVIEVHLSNIYAREEFRRKSVIAQYAKGQISGFGPKGYILALDGLTID